MLTAIHLLLTYSCNLKCDHCFLHCGPGARGTMTLAQTRALLAESKRLGSVQAIYFEGGEPFLFYPLMVEGIRLAREMGFAAGIVTNGYWATSAEDAALWLRPLADLGVSDMSISDDALHYGEAGDTPAKCALAAAQAVGIPASALRKTRPVVTQPAPDAAEKGRPEIGGGIKMRGRAAERFTQGLPTRCCEELGHCPFEDLRDPQRVHIGCDGNVQLCQGVSMGNCWKTPLSELAGAYDPDTHPIAGPLLRGGPARLVEEHGLRMPGEYVDECHLCYAARLALLDRFPVHLAPRQAYGLGPE